MTKRKRTALTEDWARVQAVDEKPVQGEWGLASFGPEPCHWNVGDVIWFAGREFRILELRTVWTVDEPRPQPRLV